MDVVSVIRFRRGSAPECRVANRRVPPFMSCNAHEVPSISIRTPDLLQIHRPSPVEQENEFSAGEAVYVRRSPSQIELMYLQTLRMSFDPTHVHLDTRNGPIPEFLLRRIRTVRDGDLKPFSLDQPRLVLVCNLLQPFASLRQAI